MIEEKKKVMVVDDSALMRSTITKILRKSPHLEICGQAGDGDTPRLSLHRLR